MTKEIHRKEIDGKIIFSVPVKREEFGTKDCVNYRPHPETVFIIDEPGKPIKDLAPGESLCNEGLFISPNCYIACEEFCISGAVDGAQLQEHKIPEIKPSTSYCSYYFPTYTKNRMFITPVKNGYDKIDVQQTVNFIAGSLDMLLM